MWILSSRSNSMNIRLSKPPFNASVERRSFWPKMRTRYKSLITTSICSQWDAVSSEISGEPRIRWSHHYNNNWHHSTQTLFHLKRMLPRSSLHPNRAMLRPSLHLKHMIRRPSLHLNPAIRRPSLHLLKRSSLYLRSPIVLLHHHRRSQVPNVRVHHILSTTRIRNGDVREHILLFFNCFIRWFWTILVLSCLSFSMKHPTMLCISSCSWSTVCVCDEESFSFYWHDWSTYISCPRMQDIEYQMYERENNMRVFSSDPTSQRQGIRWPPSKMTSLLAF